MKVYRPGGLLAGYQAVQPDSEVPELRQCGEAWAPNEFPIGSHAHQVWEFYFQIDGESHWRTSSAAYALLPGSFFAVAPHVSHRLVNRLHGKHHFYWAIFDLNALLRRQPDLQKLWRGRKVVSCSNAENMNDAFRQLMRGVTRSHPLRSLVLRSALESLMIEASAFLVSNAPEVSLIPSHAGVEKARSLLEKEPQRPWKLRELARTVGLSESYLVDTFTRETGISPRQYLLRIRIERAKKLLRQSDISITELALESGFSSSQHFASTFKKIVGNSPRHYRADRPRS